MKLSTLVFWDTQSVKDKKLLFCRNINRNTKKAKKIGFKIWNNICLTFISSTMPKQENKLPILNAKNLRTVLKLTKFDKVTPCQINVMKSPQTFPGRNLRFKSRPTDNCNCFPEQSWTKTNSTNPSIKSVANRFANFLMY